MKKIILSIVVMASALLSFSQSPVGKWKMQTMYGISHSGKKMKEFNGVVENDPCQSKIIYQFMANGKINTQGGDCPEDADANKYVGWKSQGNKTITLTVEGYEDDPDTFELEFEGNKMRWIKRFPKQAWDNANDLGMSVLEFVKV